MRDMMGKAKEKMVQKIVRKKVEKALGKESDGEDGGGGGGGGGEDEQQQEGGYDTDNTEATTTSKGSSGFGSKIANRFRKSKRSKKKSESSDTENVTKESNTETPIQTSDGSEQNEDTDHFSVPSSQDNSDWESDNNTSDTEKSRGKDLAFDKEMSKPMIDDLPQDKKTKFTIAVRIIDAIELQGFEGQELSPMVRTVVGKKCRKTHVIRGTDNPHWDQTLYFTMNKTLQELSTKTAEFRVYSAGSLLRNSLIGGFRYDLGLIYKSPNHKALGKWLALRSVSDDSETEDGQIRGFLRICAGITYPGFSGSMSLPFNPNDCEVVDAADALCYRLQFRAFKLQSIVYDVRFSNKKAPKAPVLLGIEIMLGQHRVESSFQEANDENTALNEELLLPIMWPSVSRKIRIRLLSKKHKKAKKAVVCTAFLDMKELCQSGDNGYLPLFGPSFINFYGPDLTKNKLSSSEQKRMKNGDTECTSFYGRLFAELDCEAVKIPRATVRDLTAAAVGGSETYYCRRNFTLFASFFSANMINAEFKSNNVQYAISIGEFGNPDYDLVLNSSDRSLPSMPIYDSAKFYAMPWGTHKPICEVQCSWENILPRIYQSNAIFRICKMLKEFREEAEARSANNTEVGALISVVINAIDETLCALHFIENCVTYDKMRDSDMIQTQLDIHLQQNRFVQFDLMRGKLETFKFTAVEASKMEEPGIQKLVACAKELEDLVVDAQISIPDVIIWMLVDRETVAFAKIPIGEITFSTNEMRSGIDCGKLKTIYFKWIKQKRHNRKLMEETLPSVLQARLWFGLSEYRQFWEHSLAPGKMKYFAELFVNEKRKLLSSTFTPTSHEPFGISDETGAIELSEQTVHPPGGWKFKGNWRQQRTHDMYVGPESGKRRFEDECFEVQRQDNEEWIHEAYTSYYGDQLKESELEKAPSGWEFEGKWEVDLFQGGADGWIYSLDDKFSDKSGACDVCERIGHKFRRRRLKRFRTLKNNSFLWSLYEDAEIFKKRCDEFGWEYAQKFDKPLHMQQQRGDQFRRKRMLREITRERNNAYKLAIRVDGNNGGYTAPRIYEVHSQISSFQLRVYVLWARELVCTEKVVTRTYVRVFFLHRCQETAVIKHTTNPIYNETLIFDEVLVSGGILSLQKNPPSAVIEVLGETFEGIDLVLGRFELAPTVLAAAEKEAPKIRWYNISSGTENGKGALLIYAEMYQTDPNRRRLLPKLPCMKKSNRYEVPPEYRPNFVVYNVQILCWGMRNLQRFRLTKIRQPWLEVSVADVTGQTIPLKDADVSPNFEDPLLTFHEVLMPEKLYYAPPIQIALFDQRTFGMQPQVGVCTISNFTNYLKIPQPPVPINPDDWIEYDTIAANEREEERLEMAKFEREKLGDSDEFFAFPDDPNSPRIDWWCRYYFSIDEKERAPGYAELGFNKMKVFKKPLEEVGDYNGFGDFLDTFYLQRTSRKRKRNKNNRTRDICGEMKGKLFIMRHNDKNKKLLLDQVPGAEFEGVVPCLVRVYIVRAYDLVSCNKNGIIDPCVQLRIGKRKLTSTYIPETTKPIFGHMFELLVNIPKETTLKISVVDKKRFFGGEEICETTIDLENRLLTKHRATVGMPEMYNLFGPLPWRDQHAPMEILSRYCRKMGYSPPRVLRIQDDCGIEVFGCVIWKNAIEPEEPRCEHLLGRPIQRVALFILQSIGLVPEHVETRPLFSAINPDLEVGKLECFIDIFPKSLGTIPPPIDITPRKPDVYQLRVAIFKTRNVVLIKRSFGNPAADLYVRCYLNGATKAEKTDIHFRVMDGAASFNYRLLFNFEYDPWERMIAAKRKTRLFRKAASELVEPVLVIQICDNNKFSKDVVIGEMLMPLLGFEEGHPSEENMVNVKYHKERNFKCCISCCVFCWRTRCCLRPEKRKKIDLPRAPLYIPNKMRILSMFQQKSVRGWWPCLSSKVPKEQRSDYSERKKDDDYDPLKRYVTGMLEMELSLVSAAEAKAEPVGKKRGKPNRNPFLPRPDRSKWDYFWCTSRFRVAMKFFWKKCGAQFLCYLAIILIVVLLIASFVWQFPNIMAMVASNSINNVIG